MAGVRDNKLTGLGPWPAGINNLAKEGRLPTDENGRRIALREADNIDLDRDGYATRRKGPERFYQGTLTHSVWSHDDLDFGLFVDADALCVVYRDGSTDALGLDVGNMPVSFDLIGDRIFFCNRMVSGMIDADRRVWPWSPEHPSGQPDLAPVTGFGLNPGQYQVAVTFVDELGRESGAVLAAVVQVGEGEGIAVANIPQPQAPSTIKVNLYLSNANDQVLRLHSSLPSGVTNTLIGADAQGRALTTQFLTPLPAGDIVRGHNGRQFVADGRYLRWSQPMRYGMTDRTRNVIRFNARIDMMEPIGAGTAAAGVFVAAGQRTYWHGGADPANWNQKIAYSAGVVPGTSLQVSGDVLGFESADLVQFWLATNGQFCVGVPGGNVIPLKSGEASVNAGDRGATLFRKFDGIQQLVTTLRGPRRNGLAITDKPIAHYVYDETASNP